VFDPDTCSLNGCSKEIWAGSEFCRKHHPDAVVYQAKLVDSILKNKGKIESRDLSAITLCDTNFEDLSFTFCRFTGAVFNRVSFRGTRFFMCLLDDISAVDCDFKASKMMSVVAAGSDFSNTSFAGSNLINVSFNGIKGDFTNFDESDLFSSRFIAASLNSAQFRDCNLRFVDFTNARLRNTDFSNSNPNEAYLMTIPAQ